MSEITLGKKIIKKNKKDFYIIAEIGMNYIEWAENKNIVSIEAAKLLINAAAENGADAAKFQIYDVDKLVSRHSPEYKKKKNQLNYDDYFELIDYCKKKEIDFAASLFDEEAVDIFGPYLNYFKIASPDIIYEKLIKKIANYEKPVLISTGAATFQEIIQATGWVSLQHNFNSCVMHCVSAYPTLKENTNLGAIKKLGKFLPYVIGYSDHSKFNLGILSTAYMLGARVIEKHFTLSSKWFGTGDHEHSMAPHQLFSLRRELENLGEILYNPKDGYLAIEENTRIYARRSAVAKKDIKTGEKIKDDLITFLRPGTGITDCKKVIGKIAKCDIKEGYIIRRNEIS